MVTYHDLLKLQRRATETAHPDILILCSRVLRPALATAHQYNYSQRKPNTRRSMIHHGLVERNEYLLKW